MHVSRRADHSPKLFFIRTIAAQIHFLTALLAFVGLLALLYLTRDYSYLHQWGVSVFGATSCLVFIVSAVYHFLHDGYESSARLGYIMELLDQSAIYLFIAGTYTPMVLNALNPASRFSFLVLVWSIAIVGIFYTFFRPYLWGWLQKRMVYTGGFLMMGWTLLIKIQEILHNMSSPSVLFLFLGIFFYSVGAVVYATKRPKLLEGIFSYHELWHLLVTLGFLSHFGMVASFYIKF